MTPEEVAEARSKKYAYNLEFRANMSPEKRARFQKQKNESSKRRPGPKRDWVKRNPEKMKAARAAWKSRNLQRIREKARLWAKNNPYKLAAYKEYHSLKNASLRRENPEFYRVKRREEKAMYAVNSKASKDKRLKLIRESTEGDRLEIVRFIASMKSDPDAKCAYCDMALIGKLMHTEHIVPLSRGGKHAIRNLCLSCRSCNSSKNTKTPEEFYAWKRKVKDFKNRTTTGNNGTDRTPTMTVVNAGACEGVESLL